MMYKWEPAEVAALLVFCIMVVLTLELFCWTLAHIICIGK